MILDSKNVEYEIIDITEPGKELEKISILVKTLVSIIYLTRMIIAE